MPSAKSAASTPSRNRSRAGYAFALAGFSPVLKVGVGGSGARHAETARMHQEPERCKVSKGFILENVA